MTNNVKTVRTNRWTAVVLGDNEEATRDRGQQQDPDSAIDGVSQRQELAIEADLSDEMNRLGEPKGRVSNAEPLDKKDTFRNLFPMWKFPTLEKKLFLQKENHREL